MTCRSCAKKYTPDTAGIGVILDVSVAEQDKDEIRELTLFTPQVEKILKAKNMDTTLATPTQEIEDSLVEALPTEISFTPSPKKTKTVVSFSCHE